MLLLLAPLLVLCSVVSYTLLLSMIEYKTLVLRGDMGGRRGRAAQHPGRPTQQVRPGPGGPLHPARPATSRALH